jgi:hypothetical protein
VTRFRNWALAAGSWLLAALPFFGQPSKSVPLPPPPEPEPTGSPGLSILVAFGCAALVFFLLCSPTRKS